jgi:hypothetical protein
MLPRIPVLGQRVGQNERHGQLPAALGNDPCMVTGIRAINEPDEGLVELGIAVDCSGLTRPLPHQGVRAADRHGRWKAHQAIPKTP